MVKTSATAEPVDAPVPEPKAAPPPPAKAKTPTVEQRLAAIELAVGIRHEPEPDAA